MIDLHTYVLFLATAAVLVLSPGPDMMFVLSRTVASGTSAGLMTLVGTQAGNVVHAMLAGIGVSTVILVFPVAFAALKVAGVAYLLLLAVQAWRASATLALGPSRAPAGSLARCFLQGLTNNLANPKMIMFFLALFPQFVRPEGSLAGQSLILGTTLALMAMAWMSLAVLAVGRFRTAVVSNTTLSKVANRLAALTFVGLACRLAIQDRR